MMEEQSLLELMSHRMGCAYLSDLRFLPAEERLRLTWELERLAPRKENIREWNDALEYLAGAPPEATARAAKARLIYLLSYPCGAGKDKVKEG